MYKERMQEAKQRLEIITTLREGALVYDHPTVECIYLQFRNVLELIATASLSANPEANSELAKEGRRKWHAGDILEAVKVVNPKYYFPKPTRLMANEKSEFGQVERYRGKFRDFEGDYLTRERFTSLYDLCSRSLHTPNPFDRRARSRDRKANETLPAPSCRLASPSLEFALAITSSFCPTTRTRCTFATCRQTAVST